MEIISLSIDEDSLEKIEELNENTGFNGRSELFRKAISNLHQETIKQDNLKGHINAVIVVRHPHSHEQKIGDISHNFDDVINTQLHSKLNNERCLEIFHTEGEAGTITDFYNSLQGSKHTEAVNILPQT